MSDPIPTGKAARSERAEQWVTAALRGVYIAAFVGFFAYFIFCALTGI